MENHASRWIYVAVVYFVAAIGPGVYMSSTHDFSLRSVHVHINMLGWVSQALIGVIYHCFAEAGRSKLATAQFWLYNVTLVPMMIALALVMKGNTAAGPALGIASFAMAGCILLFAVNMFINRPARKASLLRRAELLPQ